MGLTVRTPRGREPLGHELAVIKRVIAIERHFEANGRRGARVLTERDMRRDQQGSADAAVVGGGGPCAGPARSPLGGLCGRDGGGPDGGGA